MHINDTTKRIAERMLEIFGDDPNRWTKGRFAKDAAGWGLYPTDRSAVCFCLLGAGKKAVADLDLLSDDFWNLVMAIEKIVGPHHSVPTFNDSVDTTFEMAMAPLRQLAGVAP